MDCEEVETVCGTEEAETAPKKYNRLDLETKRLIVIEAEQDKVSQRYLAKKYDVSRPQIAEILKNKKKIFEQLGIPYEENDYRAGGIEELSETDHTENVEAVPVAVKDSKKWLTLPEKKKIILEFEEGKSKRFLAQKYKVARETINTCIKRKEKIFELLESSPNTNVKRVKAEKYETINKAVFESYNESLGHGHLTGTWIKKEALYFAETFGIDTFTASNGWLDRWLKRYDIKLSNTTNLKPAHTRSSAPVYIDPIYQENSGSGAETEEAYAIAFPVSHLTYFSFSFAQFSPHGRNIQPNEKFIVFLAIFVRSSKSRWICADCAAPNARSRASATCTTRS